MVKSIYPPDRASLYEDEANQLAAAIRKKHPDWIVTVGLCISFKNVGNKPNEPHIVDVIARTRTESVVDKQESIREEIGNLAKSSEVLGRDIADASMKIRVIKLPISDTRHYRAER